MSVRLCCCVGRVNVLAVWYPAAMHKPHAHTPWLLTHRREFRAAAAVPRQLYRCCNAIAYADCVAGITQAERRFSKQENAALRLDPFVRL